MSIKAIDLRRGMAVNYQGQIWTVVENEKVLQGRGQSHHQIQLKNIRTGRIIRQRFRIEDAFEQAILERKQMEYLYSSASGHVVMDRETYDQIELPAKLIGDKAVYLAPNIEIEVAFVEGRVVIVELPNTVELTVIDTPPAIKGATATNQLKEAACEGGARIKVPPFVENGVKVKVDTRTGEYISRA